MNLEVGFQFIIFLVLFGFTNYLMMLKRYENDLEKRQIIKKKRISNLYPKGTFIGLWINKSNRSLIIFFEIFCKLYWDTFKVDKKNFFRITIFFNLDN